MIKNIIFSIVIAGLLIVGSLALTQSAPIAVADTAFCGDGVVNQPSEECDGSSDCTSGCVFAFCGDGVVNQSAEQCDGSAGVRSGYRCSSGCILQPVDDAPFCGDGVVNQPAEECDGGASCTSGCRLSSGDDNGGGGGGGGGSLTHPKLDVAQYGDMPRAPRGGTTALVIEVKSIGTATAHNTELKVALPNSFAYTGGPVMVFIKKGSNMSGSFTADSAPAATIDGKTYTLAWKLGSLSKGEDAVIFIPVRASVAAQPGTYDAPVLASRTNGRDSNKNVTATAKIEVTSGSVVISNPTPKPTSKPVSKPVSTAKPVKVAVATSTVCIPADTYAALLDASSTLAQIDESDTANAGLLAAVGSLFDLGTGSTCFGLIILLLLILAIVIIARLLYHYFGDEDGTGEGDGQATLLP